MNDTLQTRTGKPLRDQVSPAIARTDVMKNLSHILLDKLGRRARAGGHTLKIVAGALPTPLADSLLFARLDAGCLVLTVATPGAATRMRFCQRDILAACAHADMRAKTVKFKVSPHPPAADHTPAKRDPTPTEPRLSEAAAEQLDSLASGVTCEALQSALVRLSKHAKRR